MTWIDEVNFDAHGLIPVIAQEKKSNKVLMFAWMSHEALKLTVETGFAVYWSRTRSKLWRKGEVSGHQQKVYEIRLDCDEDVILLIVEQVGGIACHTGRHSCFFKKLEQVNDKIMVWKVDEPIIKNPEDIYHTQA